MKDLTMVLQSPAGTAVVVSANVGGPTEGSCCTPITFRDADILPAAPPVPADGVLLAGAVYRPTDLSVAFLNPPGPPLPYYTTFSAFDGQPIAGAWKFWVYDKNPATHSGVIQVFFEHVLQRDEDVPLSTTVSSVAEEVSAELLRRFR